MAFSIIYLRTYLNMLRTGLSGKFTNGYSFLKNFTRLGTLLKCVTFVFNALYNNQKYQIRKWLKLIDIAGERRQTAAAAEIIRF